MFKTIFLMKRKSGMSFEDFVNYYESVHSNFVHVCAPGAKRYLRKYLRPLEGSDGEFDVVMELWFESREQLDAARNNRDPELRRRLSDDEKLLFDTSRMLGFSYEEKETQLKAT